MCEGPETNPPRFDVPELTRRPHRSTHTRSDDGRAAGGRGNGINRDDRCRDLWLSKLQSRFSYQNNKRQLLRLALCDPVAKVTVFCIVTMTCRRLRIIAIRLSRPFLAEYASIVMAVRRLIRFGFVVRLDAAQASTVREGMQTRVSEQGKESPRAKQNCADKSHGPPDQRWKIATMMVLRQIIPECQTFPSEILVHSTTKLSQSM